MRAIGWWMRGRGWDSFVPPYKPARRKGGRLLHCNRRSVSAARPCRRCSCESAATRGFLALRVTLQNLELDPAIFCPPERVRVRGDRSVEGKSAAPQTAL